MIEDSVDNDDDEPPHDLVDSLSDEDTPDVPLAVAKQKSLRKRRVDLQQAKTSTDADPIDDTHDLTIESIWGSLPSADDDRRVGHAVKNTSRAAGAVETLGSGRQPSES